MIRPGVTRITPILAVLTLTGCAPKLTQFQIVDYAEVGSQESYTQGFSECYYDEDSHGHIDIVARDRTIGDDGVPLTQMIHMQTFWRVKPGTTHAEPTMINATVCYAILSNPTGATFEGSGFLVFKESRDKKGVIGELELATVKPHRRLGNAEKIFNNAEITGTFIASRNEDMVRSILKEMERTFGAMPLYNPSRDQGE